MSGLAPVKEDKRVTALLETAQEALRHVRDRTALPSKLAHDIDAHITRSFASVNPATVLRRVKEFDAYGTDLWNAASIIIPEDQETSTSQSPAATPTASVAPLRVFALLLLDAAQSSSSRRRHDPGQQMRLLRVANKTAKSCLQRHRLALSMAALEVASKYLPRPVKPPSPMQFTTAEERDLDEHEVSVRSLQREYYLLRMLAADDSARRDLADHFYQAWASVVVPASDRVTDDHIHAAEIFLQIAQNPAASEPADSAWKWYERALETLQTHTEDAGSDMTDLLLNIAIPYVNALLHHGDDTAIARANDVVARLSRDSIARNRLAVPVLQLSVLVKLRHVDSQEIRRILHNISIAFHLTEHNLKMFLQAASKVCQLLPVIATTELRSFIVERILPELRTAGNDLEQVQDWLEKSAITYTMWITQQTAAVDHSCTEALLSLFNQIYDFPVTPFTSKAAHAAQTLIWKAASAGDATTAPAFGQLLRHPLLDNTGHLNKGRIGRRIIRSALDINDPVAAREAFLAMPVNAQNEPATRYLAFQLALRTKDHELAQECLRVIVQNAGTDATYLYACALDAQSQPPLRPIAVLALHAVLELRPPGVQLGPLLRCMAKLLMSEVETPNAGSSVILLEVVSIFEIAAGSIAELRKCPLEHWLHEVQWWSKNSYNLAIRVCLSTDADLLLRLLATCRTFMESYPVGPLHDLHNQLAERKRMCLLLSTTALIASGRSSKDDSKAAKARFSEALSSITAFKQLSNTTERNDKDGSARAFTMAKFELECVLRLEKWNLLNDILQSCLQMRCADRWDALADLLIVIHGHLDASEKQAHTAQITQLLQRAINDSWKKDKDIEKVSRWLRYAFMMCMDHAEGDFARKLLDQAARMAENGQRGKYGLYPEAELQWLATTGFNHAIDLISKGLMEQAKQWLESAVEVARWTQDNGALHAVLTGKRRVAEERIHQSTG